MDRFLADLSSFTAAFEQQLFDEYGELLETSSGDVAIVNGVLGDHGATILAGNQKVLAARLADAKFFWENDIRVAEAGAGGRSFAVVTTTPGLERSVDRLMRAHAGAGRYLGCFLTEGDPLRLMEDADMLDRALLEGIGRAAGQG